jgi:hypothetical protein
MIKDAAAWIVGHIGHDKKSKAAEFIQLPVDKVN